MRSKITALTLAGALFFSPLAMASDLSSSDSEFLFGSNQVATTTISAGEMTTTEGQSITVDVRTKGTARVDNLNVGANANTNVDIDVDTP